MYTMIKQYADKIRGTFSFFDRMILNGYILPLLAEQMRAGALSQLGILYKDFKTYFTAVTDTSKSNIENHASKFGHPVRYLVSPSICKEEAAREILISNPIDEGLICVLKTMEACKTAKVYGSDSGKLVVKTTFTKCLHYYLYYLDKEFG